MLSAGLSYHMWSELIRNDSGRIYYFTELSATQAGSPLYSFDRQNLNTSKNGTDRQYQTESHPWHNDLVSQPSAEDHTIAQLTLFPSGPDPSTGARITFLDTYNEILDTSRPGATTK